MILLHFFLLKLLESIIVSLLQFVVMEHLVVFSIISKALYLCRLSLSYYLEHLSLCSCFEIFHREIVKSKVILREMVAPAIFWIFVLKSFKKVLKRQTFYRENDISISIKSELICVNWQKVPPNKEKINRIF